MSEYRQTKYALKITGRVRGCDVIAWIRSTDESQIINFYNEANAEVGRKGIVEIVKIQDGKYSVIASNQRGFQIS